jgi:Flp pilus assembly protein protease CpaA
VKRNGSIEQMQSSALTFWISFLVLLVAAWIDLRQRRIPNYIVAPYLLAGLAVRGLSGAEALLTGLAGFTIAGLVAGGLHLLTGFGMGDVKLLSAFGWWVGPSQLRYALPAVALAGGIWALGLVAARGLRKQASAAGQPDRLGDRRGQTMPYAPAIALGAMFSFFAH